MSEAGVSRRWRWFLALSLLLALALRMTFVQDMEYKEDEEFDFTQSQPSAPWSWVGMPSGVFVPNPGMSVWVFKWLAWAARATTPTGLAHAVQLFAVLGIVALIAFGAFGPFAWRGLRGGREATPTAREPWLWAAALACVNPFLVFYQRKLWPEPLLPVFSILWLAGWWRRDRWLGAFAWGFVGAWLGQIHMSGFFIAFALLLCTLVLPSLEIPRARVRWGAWFLGSCLGSLPLLPWAWYWYQHPIHETIARGWEEISQLKFWVFWVTDPLGLTLSNPLGLLRGPSQWEQISDFARYPLLGGHATWLCGLAHLVAIGAGAVICLPGLRRWWADLARERWLRRLVGRNRDDLSIALIAAFWGFGLLLTASSIVVRRYYLMVSFPLEFVWLARLALRCDGLTTPLGHRAGTRALGALWAAQLFISACFVGYVHVNEGSTQGDYGDAYHVVMKKRGLPAE